MRFSALLLAFLLASPRVHADQPLVVAFDDGSVPTMYADASGEAAGVYPGIVRRAFALIGEPVRLIAVPFTRIKFTFENGSAAMGSAVITPDRLALGDYSEPYFVEQVNVYQRVGSWPAYVDLASLNGKTVGVIRGWSYGAAFDKARRAGLFKVDEVGQDSQNFAKLAIGRLDFAVATAMAGKLAQSQPGAPMLSVGEHPLISIPIHLLINKKKHALVLLHRFNVAVEQLRASGEINAIVNAELERARTSCLPSAARIQGGHPGELFKRTAHLCNQH